ncbi:MAG: phenylalanine--tRNA ligase subunit alpha, partial [Dehalococcoidales bacterium]|nr:phenylalanine--tRNA ligase subunit alpha [Dehalococcoidales bacterium]
MSAIQQLEELKTTALAELDEIADLRRLASWRVRYLGKKSRLTGILRGLAGLSLEEKKAVGAAANKLKLTLEEGFEQWQQALRDKRVLASTEKEGIDISLPGRFQPAGRLHPVTQVTAEINDIFISMGFEVVEGPEVELDYYNFEALNIPREHPARDTMATLWVDHGTDGGQQPMLLRTHTSPMQIRVMEKVPPPLRIVVPGKVYRYEATDATHIPMFYQIEGLAVDKGITMADLKGTLYEFARRFFGEERKVRFRCD